MPRTLTLDLLPGLYAVARPGADAAIQIPSARACALRVLIDDPRERTLICPEADLPDDLEHTQGWRALLIADDTEFDEPGILVSITRPVAERGIGLLGYSTFTADIVMVAQDDLAATIAALRDAGHIVQTPSEGS